MLFTSWPIRLKKARAFDGLRTASAMSTTGGRSAGSICLRAPGPRLARRTVGLAGRRLVPEELGLDPRPAPRVGDSGACPGLRSNLMPSMDLMEWCWGSLRLSFRNQNRPSFGKVEALVRATDPADQNHSFRTLDPAWLAESDCKGVHFKRGPLKVFYGE